MSGFRFQDPMRLLIIIPLAMAVWWSMRRQGNVAVLYSSVQLLKSLPWSFASGVKRMLPWIRLLGLCFVVLALARPQQGKEEFRVRTEGIAIQMCIDNSGSMQAMDFVIDDERVNRLDAVKHVFRDFVTGTDDLPGRPNDFLGLIAFGGYADSKCPLTLDHGALLEVLDTIKIPEEIYDDRGQQLNAELLQEELSTAIGDALALAVDHIKDSKVKSKVIILLSDGENNAGVTDPREAARVAKQFGIRIYSIGVGSTGQAPFPTIDLFGRTVLRPQLVQLDEKTLRGVAELTGGKYFNAQNTEALREVYAEIDQLERTVSEGQLYTEYRELYRWFLFSGIGLLLLDTVLVCTRFRSLP